MKLISTSMVTECGESRDEILAKMLNCLVRTVENHTEVQHQLTHNSEICDEEGTELTTMTAGSVSSNHKSIMTDNTNVN